MHHVLRFCLMHKELHDRSNTRMTALSDDIGCVRRPRRAQWEESCVFQPILKPDLVGRESSGNLVETANPDETLNWS